MATTAKTRFQKTLCSTTASASSTITDQWKDLGKILECVRICHKTRTTHTDTKVSILIHNFLSLLVRWWLIATGGFISGLRGGCKVES